VDDSGQMGPRARWSEATPSFASLVKAPKAPPRSVRTASGLPCRAITFLTEAGDNVADKTTFAENAFYRIVGDKSPAAGYLFDGRKPTVIEIVTTAVDEHTEEGREALIAMLDAVESLEGISTSSAATLSAAEGAG